MAQVQADNRAVVCQCACCGRAIKAGYKFCFGCYRKRMKVYDDCIGAGKSVEFARDKVNEAYPLKFA